MRTCPIPGTDLDLSLVGFGCWAIGGQYWGDDWDDTSSAGAVEAALDHGINWFDTAPLYGEGHADEVLAAALGSRKHDVTIATKVGPRMDPSTGHAISDLTAQNIARDCEASLQRLGLDTIDLLQVHWPCNLGTPIDETLDALEDLQARGLVRHFGLCNYNAETLRYARSRSPIVTLQTPYSMVRREFEHGLRDACGPEDPDSPPLGVFAYETLCRGLLTGKFGPTPPTFPDSDMRSHDERFRGHAYAQIHQLNRAIAVLAEKLGVPHAAMAPAWVLSRPGVTHAIVGAKRAAQVEEIAQAHSLVHRTKVWNALDRYIDQVRP